MSNHRFADLETARAYTLAGNATLTLESLKTGTHYTFRVRQATDKKSGDPVPGLYFVNLLTTGNADEGNFVYVGIIRDGKFTLTQKSGFGVGSGPVHAWAFFWACTNAIPEQLAVYHHGTCGRCGRTLTVPSSIDAGIGPECLTKMEGALL
jgi:hypothetical protein